MSIKRIFSAGGIVIRKSTTSTKGIKSTKGVEVLVTQHSGHKGWDFPKGHREIYESEEQAALREVEEETGVKAEIVERVGETRYFYYEPSSTKVTEGKERVLKTVVFYLMKYLGEGEATTAFEVSDKVWLAVDKVEEQLTFKDTKELWRKVKDKIGKLQLASGK